MANVVRGPRDDYVKAIKHALDEYERQFPGSEASLYRQNSASVRVRIVDDLFAGMGKSRRHDQVQSFLRQYLNEEQMSEISVLVLLARNELGSSLMNLEFQDPVRSRL